MIANLEVDPPTALKRASPKFPSNWPLKAVGELFETQLGKMLSDKARGGSDPKLYLRNKNVQWGYIEVLDVLRMDFNEREKEKFKLNPGDLLVCEGGVVGRAALWKGEIGECYYQKALHRLRVRRQLKLPRDDN